MIIDECCNIIIFFIISLILSIILVIFIFILKNNNIVYEKSTPYECGFEEFNDASITFDNQFFIIGIVFVLFDLETVFLIPWAVSLHVIGLFGCFFVFLFVIPLIFGFVYEIKRGVLVWIL